jgi:hypothetical protein
MRLRLIATLACFAVLVVVFVSGCGPRVVLVTEDSPVRAGEHVRGQVYVLVDGVWVPSRNKVQVPEGWYMVPPSFVESDQ